MTANEFDSVFGSLPSEGEIFIPDDAFAVRNNCQTGQWNVGGTQNLGSKLSFRALKFARFFGSLGQTSNEMWGQLWFVAEPGCGDFPASIAALTYIKTRSLTNFLTLINLIKARGVNPVSGVFTAAFNKESRAILDPFGNPSQGHYYYLSWDWSADKESAYTSDQIRAAIAGTATKYDSLGTSQMVNFDLLSERDRSALVASSNLARSLVLPSAE
jgi:hypothetical protein